VLLICPVCSKEFEGRPNKDYCSPGCKLRAKLRRRRERRQKNPNNNPGFLNIPTVDTVYRQLTIPLNVVSKTQKPGRLSLDRHPKISNNDKILKEI